MTIFHLLLNGIPINYLSRWLGERRLYNAALEEWRWAYTAGVSVCHIAVQRTHGDTRRDAFWGGMSVNVGRGVLRRADRARQSFYRRVSSGERRDPASRGGAGTIELANVVHAQAASHYCAIRIKGLPEIRREQNWRCPKASPRRCP